MTHRRLWLRRAVLVVTAAVGLQQLWRHGHDYIFPSRLVTVEPGKIFRGAWQKPWPMRDRSRSQDQDRSRPGPHERRSSCDGGKGSRCASSV